MQPAGVRAQSPADDVGRKARLDDMLDGLFLVGREPLGDPSKVKEEETEDALPVVVFGQQSGPSAVDDPNLDADISDEPTGEVVQHEQHDGRDCIVPRDLAGNCGSVARDEALISG